MSPKADINIAIVEAIRALKNPKGSSAVKICSSLAPQFDPKVVKKALKKAVEKGVLAQTGQSFKVIGDAEYEDTSEKVAIHDLVVGSGPEVVAGDTVTISYVGKCLKLDGTTLAEFDAAKSFSFQVKAGDVVKGMDAGVLGMQLGGKRDIVIPPSLGYGKRGSGPEIPPNSTLHFGITLNKIA